jgi:hypothetical protein
MAEACAMTKPLALEQRIAAALTPTDITSTDTATDLAPLIAEVEAAAAAADENATRAREEALDPAVVVDTAKVGAAVATATLTRDRLQAALPRLQERLKRAREREYAECWLNGYAAVKVRRDAAAEQLRERYPTIVAELVALMADIAATDNEIDRINTTAPHGDYPRLRGVELTARGLDRLLQPDISIVQELRLPCFDCAPDMPLMAYPLPVPNLALQSLSLMPPDNFDWRNWQEECEERDRRALQENRRQIAEAEARLRAREEREAAEARKANQVAVGR